MSELGLSISLFIFGPFSVILMPLFRLMYIVEMTGEETESFTRQEKLTNLRIFFFCFVTANFTLKLSSYWFSSFLSKKIFHVGDIRKHDYCSFFILHCLIQAFQFPVIRKGVVFQTTICKFFSETEVLFFSSLLSKKKFNK